MAEKPSELAVRLQNARIRLQLTQDDMARAVGISRGEWILYERGRTIPEGLTLSLIAGMCGWTEKELLDGPRCPSYPGAPVDPKARRRYMRRRNHWFSDRRAPTEAELDQDERQWSFSGGVER